MAQTPGWKVYDHEGQYVAACKRPVDAVIVMANYPKGAKIKWDHNWVLWTLGGKSREEQTFLHARDHVGAVAAIVQRRLAEKQLERARRVF